MTVDMVDNLESVTKIYEKGVKIYLVAYVESRFAPKLTTHVDFW